MLALGLLCAAPVQASEWRLLDTDGVYFEAEKHWHLYDPYWDRVRYEYNQDDEPIRKSGEYWTYGIAAGFDLVFMARNKFKWYWKNRVEGDSTNHQFRRVAWQYEFGWTFNKLDIFHSHKSEHLLETEYPGFYPLKDSFGFRLHFAK